MSYDLSVISQGSGIGIDKSASDKIKIVNTQQKYNLSSKPILSVLDDFNNATSNYNIEINLLEFSNYVKLDNGQSQTFSKPIVIYINDTVNQWKVGQCFTFVVDRFSPINLYSNGNYYLEFRTDANDKLGNGNKYGKVIMSISGTEILTKGGVPKIELVCLDSTNLIFSSDLF